LWAKIDNYNWPIHSYTGDTYHYLSIFRSAVIDGKTNSNAFFWEQSNDPSQFYIFQKIASTLNPFANVSIVWFDVLLRISVAFLVCFLLYKLLTLLEVESLTAYIYSLAITLIYGAVAFKGYALGNWFIPALLGGIYCVMYFSRDVNTSSKSILFMYFAMILFAVHPVYFTMGGLACLFAWASKLYKNRSKKILLLFLLWCLVSLFLFSLLFLHFLVGSTAGNDTIFRIVAISTRLPIHVLTSIRLITLAIVAWLISEETLSFFVVASFIGLNSYILTGTYIANDHYAFIIEDFIGILLALSIIYNYKKKIKIRPWLGYWILLLFSITFFEVLRYLNFRPGYLGRWFPMLAGYFLLGLLFVSDKSKTILKRFWSTKLIWLLMVISILYSGTILYKDNISHISKHKDIQSYRALIEELNLIPPGVVLADPKISNAISLYTKHKVYWLSEGFSETVTNKELEARWSDASIFFPNDPSMRGPDAISSVIGNANRCYVHMLNDYYDALAKIGITIYKKDLCDTYDQRYKTWQSLLNKSQIFIDYATSTLEWSPAYKLDWLVLKTDERPPIARVVGSFFKPYKVVGDNFLIYHFNSSAVKELKIN
jgi:hypothetical protein